jgi:hypothetical protein
MKIMKLKIVHRSNEDTLNVVTISCSSEILFCESEGGFAMAEVVIHPHPTTKTQVQSQSSSFGQSGTGAGFSPSPLFSCQYFTNAFYSLTHSLIHSFIHSRMMNALIMNAI